MKMTKQHLKKLLTWGLPLTVFVFIAVTQGPVIYQNFQSQGKTLPSVSLVNLETQSKTTLPNGENNLIIFWASWCAPCKLEMARIKNSVEDGTISPENVFALNPFERPSKIKRFLDKNSYPFQFVSDNGKLAHFLDVKATPTFVWLKKEEIYRVSTGIHVIGIYLLESFLP